MLAFNIKHHNINDNSRGKTLNTNFVNLLGGMSLWCTMYIDIIEPS